MVKVTLRRGSRPARTVWIALAATAALALTGCAELDSGKIVDKVQESGRQEYDCDTVGSGKSKRKVCGFDQLPDMCMFQLDNGKEKGWLEIDCATQYNAYQVGENYPR